MEKQQASQNSLQLEPALTNMILNPKTEKISRPLNAFMLFARDHRRLIACQHPDVCNKTVSTLLGKVWKSAPEEMKSRYYKKAKMLAELHKTRYPDYVYCPREARIQKMNRKKKVKEKRNFCLDSLQQNAELRADITMKIKKEDILNEEGRTTAMEPDPSPGPAYIPNNPEFFSEHSSNMNSDEEQELDERLPRCPYPLDSHQYHPDQDGKNERGQTSHGMRRCCDREKFSQSDTGFQEKPISENEMINPYYPDYIPCTYAPHPTFFKSHDHFSPPPISPCCFSPPPMIPCCFSPPPRSSPGLRPCGSPFHPYWNLPTMNSSCFPSSRESAYENLKPYPTYWHTPDYFGHSLNYAAQFNQKPSYKFWPPFNEIQDNFQQEQKEHFSENSGYFPSSSRYVNKGNNYSHSCVGNSAVDDEMIAQNERIVRANIVNKEDMRNHNQGCKRETRMHDSANSLSSAPVYSKDDNLSQNEEKNRISADHIFSREKCQLRAAYDTDSQNEGMLADFSNFGAQVRPEESSNYGEFSRSNSHQNNQSSAIRVQSEETSNLPGSSQSDNDRNNFKNMHVPDVPSKLINVSPSCSFRDSPKIPFWHTPVIKSNFPDNITQEECNRSWPKLDPRSISDSLQNNVFALNKMTTNTPSAGARSKYTDHNKNDLENTKCNHSMEMSCKAPNPTVMGFYSDLQNYPSQANQQMSALLKKYIPEFTTSSVEENNHNVYSKHSENNSKPQDEE